VWKHDAQDGNGDAHLKAGLLGPSETIPLIEGKLGLSRWQNIFFCEFGAPQEALRGGDGAGRSLRTAGWLPLGLLPAGLRGEQGAQILQAECSCSRWRIASSLAAVPSPPAVLL
jgi:hypothetical protein